MVVASTSDGQSVATSSFPVTVYQPPKLAPIASQTDTAGLPLAVTLQGSDPDGDTLTYAASAETQTYWLQQTYGFYEDQGGYYNNDRGQEEEYLRAKVSVNGYNTGGIDPWYYILPNGFSTSSLLRTRIRRLTVSWWRSSGPRSTTTPRCSGTRRTPQCRPYWRSGEPVNDHSRRQLHRHLHGCRQRQRRPVDGQPVL